MRAAAVDRHGGQTLVSQATYEVLVDGLHDDVELRDLGIHRLRDLDRREHVWQLRHPELFDAFPPLRSLDAVAHNLPVELTSFVGREAAIDVVRGVLGEHRLVTLTGAGGCGKTRLALQVAARAADDFPDGIWWVDLAPLTDPSLVRAALAGALGVRESLGEPITDTVVRYLAARRALLGLDNCEHLIEACAALAARLIDHCPVVTVLATSRELLGVAAETTWPVPPLTVPHDSAVPKGEAVQLFIDRARAARPNAALFDDSPAIADICIRLDGIPLAIELAAARARVLSVAQIAAGLADRFHLLTGGARTALPRQRTLERSVDWSHDLLGDAEQIVFRRLAVFAGTFSAAAAQVVCADDLITGAQVADLLRGLVDRSLVQVADVAGPQIRYRLLETIRDYASHKMSDAGEAERGRRRHLAYYLAFAEEAAAGLAGPHLVAWLARVDAELDNVRAVLDRSHQLTDASARLRLVARLQQYWWARGDLGVGRARLQVAVDRARGDSADRAHALLTMAWVLIHANDLPGARRYGDEAVAIARRLDDPQTLGRALAVSGRLCFLTESDRSQAPLLYEEAIARLRPTGDSLFLAWSLAWLGVYHVDGRESYRARAPLSEALALTESSGLRQPRVDCVYGLGRLDLLEGRLDSAAAHLEEGLVLVHELGDRFFEVLMRIWLGTMHLYRGQYREAGEQFELGFTVATEHRQPYAGAYVRLMRGFCEFAQGELNDAADDLEAAFPLVGPWPGCAGICRGFQALIALTRGHVDEARRYTDDAASLLRADDPAWAIGPVRGAQAALARFDREPTRAEDLLYDALGSAVRAGQLASACLSLDALGGAVADQGRFEEAARLFGAAEAQHDAIGFVRFAGERLLSEGDHHSVRAALGAEAFEQGWAEGAARSLDEVVAYARRGRAKRKRPTHGWASLTPTELRVVELVVEGLTNPQIGERLCISRQTVRTHLSRVFTKLAVSTRAELAAKAAKRRARGP